MQFSQPVREGQRGRAHDAAVGEAAVVSQLAASPAQALLASRSALLVLDLGLDVSDGVTGRDKEREGLDAVNVNSKHDQVPHVRYLKLMPVTDGAKPPSPLTQRRP